MKATFMLYLSADFDIGAEGFWPDGDAPENATDEDAAAVVTSYIRRRGISQFLSDWSLGDGFNVSVGVYDAWPAPRAREAGAPISVDVEGSGSGGGTGQ